MSAMVRVRGHPLTLRRVVEVSYGKGITNKVRVKGHPLMLKAHVIEVNYGKGKRSSSGHVM